MSQTRPATIADFWALKQRSVLNSQNANGPWLMHKCGSSVDYVEKFNLYVCGDPSHARLLEWSDSTLTQAVCASEFYVREEETQFEPLYQIYFNEEFGCLMSRRIN